MDLNKGGDQLFPYPPGEGIKRNPLRLARKEIKHEEQRGTEETNSEGCKVFKGCILSIGW